MNNLPQFITKKQLKEWMGWSAMTIQRRVSQGCFPIYRFGHRDVRFRPEEIMHYINGKREGSFDEREVA